MSTALLDAPAPGVVAARRPITARLRPALGWVALALVVLIVGALVAVGSDNGGGALDPDNSDRPGGRALAQLLRDQGIRVDRVETADAALAAISSGPPAGTTVLVATPRLLAVSQAERLVGSGADVVVIDPPNDVLATLAPGVAQSGLADDRHLEPVCAVETARRAGRALTGGGTVYTAQTRPGRSTALCYPVDDAAAMVVLRTGEEDGARTTVLGSGSPLRNEHLADSGNAALALGLLGARPHLVWYLPALRDVPAGGRRPLSSLVPPWVTFGAVQLLVGGVLLALWRARRLGPVVTEPLPVVVRAAETVEGRARLYRRARARDLAGEALRGASRARLVELLGLVRAADATTIVANAAARSGWQPRDVGALLYGAAPGDDANLVLLADYLDALEWKVRAT